MSKNPRNEDGTGSSDHNFRRKRINFYTDINNKMSEIELRTSSDQRYHILRMTFKLQPLLVAAQAMLTEIHIRISTVGQKNHRMLGVGRDLCGSSSPTLREEK